VGDAADLDAVDHAGPVAVGLEEAPDAGALGVVDEADAAGLGDLGLGLGVDGRVVLHGREHHRGVPAAVGVDEQELLLAEVGPGAALA
jgi:hypothetical protein